MKVKDGPYFEGIRSESIAAALGLVLVLILPRYSAGQQAPTPLPGDQAAVHENDNAPVPPMPPLEAAEPSPAPANDLLPDSPGAKEPVPLEAPAWQPSGQAQSLQAANQQPLPAAPQEPLGVAAAERIPTMGIAASRPAGAALAPGKQRRVRTILIRTGALLGAAAALGVTMALTEASPSKPPGAH